MGKRLRTTRERRNEVEQILKGVSNHRRLEILELLLDNPGLSILGISEKLKVDFRTISQHTQRLTRSGLVKKKNIGPAVCHTVTTRGKSILMFCRTLE
jgi:DNA-binding transcriptional ArsR family regulator